MIRVVLDTNVVISALLWDGIARQVVYIAESNQISIYTGVVLLEELEEKLNHPKFAKKFAQTQISPSELMTAYNALVTVIASPPLSKPVCDDPDDDAVLACAIASNAKVIVSGDKDLLRLNSFETIPIMQVGVFIAFINSISI
jgi:putative PIN family toxin of toxin-antitoxin system